MDQDVKNKGSWNERAKRARDIFYKFIWFFIKNCSTVIVLSKEQITDALTFSHDKLAAKRAAKDAGYVLTENGTGDPINAELRGDNGYLAEKALEFALNTAGIMVQMDKQISSDSRLHAGADFVFTIGERSYRLGCKASHGCNAPVISRKIHKYPQAVCYVQPQEDGSCKVYICGVAYPKILNDERNRSDDGIIDTNMLDRKTAFIGFKWLTPWNTYISRILEQSKAS